MIEAKRQTAGLKARPLPFDTFRENVVLLARDNVVLRPERLAGVRRVEVKARGVSLLASPMIAEAGANLAADEIGLPQPALRRLGVAAGDLVEIAPARAPQSLDAVRAKIRGETLSEARMAQVVADLVGHRCSDMEVAAFLIACASFMTADETLALTQAMVDAGARLDWGDRTVVDKHCIGGIPGNRTSLIVTPIVAAHGLTIPKTSSRAITSPAGTADTMEVLARVDLDADEMRAVVERCGGCIVWGGRVNLAPADDVLISVERPLGVDTPEQMVASIMSKKVSAGSSHLVVDLPVGPSAKIRDPAAALRLRKLFEFVGARMGIGIEVVTTDGSRPIGRGVGPLLETEDVLAVLERRPDAPRDLETKAVMLAGRLLEIDPDVRGGQGENRARELIGSGAARRKLDEIAEAQGPSPIDAKIGALTHEVTASRAGRIGAINCLRISAVARLAGAPTDAGAGLRLLRDVGDAVRAGDPLYRIHGDEPSEFAFAVEAAQEDSGFRLEHDR
ncbi:MAG TPA: thymidine phosphorylase family protein [Caulobacteraceae bacterium]|nr:thymidine phosphorylase family protein [Caulobacteraceae bacterium]